MANRSDGSGTAPADAENPAATASATAEPRAQRPDGAQHDIFAGVRKLADETAEAARSGAVGPDALIDLARATGELGDALRRLDRARIDKVDGLAQQVQLLATGLALMADAACGLGAAQRGRHEGADPGHHAVLADINETGKDR